MSHETAILQLIHTQGLGTSTLSRLLKVLAKEERSLEDFLSSSVNELVHHYRLKNEVVQALKTNSDQAEQLSEELHKRDIHVLVKETETYPNHLIQILKETAPPVLFAKGNLDILKDKAVGFSGSRKTSEKGLAIASNAAGILAESGINIVSGYASGTDLAAHRGALNAGGVTTFVLVEGIFNFRVKREISEYLSNENYLAISEFPPRTKWIARNAMQRNRTICGLSDAMIIVESGLDGGTFAAGETTLQLNLPLFVVDYAQPPQSAEGNRYFLNKGACPLRGNGEGKPNLKGLFQSLNQENGISSVKKHTNNSSPVLDLVTTENITDKAQTTTPAQPQPMSQTTQYPKRLIEVDLPIKRISAHARREKSIRHGHISTLHIWWARRPLAACRAIICAALWPDPADPLCPEAFVSTAKMLMLNWAKNHQKKASADSFNRLTTINKNPEFLDNPYELRRTLLDFIADFANWDNSTDADYLETTRNLTQTAHEALGGIPGTKPLVVDPFAGGGAIPLEALRVGADAFASDLNPVAVLLNKVVLEYIPKYGQKLADEVRKWGQWVKEEAEKELAEFYPKDADDATPIAYLWARTITCEGPGCGAEVPLIRSLWLAKKSNRSVALHIIPNPEDKRVDFEIIEKQKGKWVCSNKQEVEIKNPNFDGTVKKGSATCPCCGYTTPVASVRRQLKERQGGAADARLFAVVTTKSGRQGRFFRLPIEQDFEACCKASNELNNRKNSNKSISLVPDELLDLRGIRHTWSMIYGFDRWGNYFTSRQSLALVTLVRLVSEAGEKLSQVNERGFAIAVQTCLALAVSKSTDLNNSICTWRATSQAIDHLFSRQAIPMAWDFAEAVLTHNASGSWESMYNRSADGMESTILGGGEVSSNVEWSSATTHPLPDDAAHALITDPPYYDAVPYSYLSDFFYVWLRRSLEKIHSDIFTEPQVPKDAEIIVDRPHELSNSTKDIAFYEKELTKAFADGSRILHPDGIGTIVFASKTTSSWEAILKAVVDAGWIITGSWPIDTEMETRVAAQGQARLASSVHLVCRPRENPDGTLREEIGDWRDVLQELPQRIHEWMPRLAAEGVVGADAIFACLGPALEIFSRYSSVEKASGEQVTLKEYLEYVWAAVSKEALGMIFSGADATGFEEDARLTAMWFWTLSTGSTDNTNDSSETEADDEDDEETSSKSSKTSGYILEFDAARKIAQGLGAHLENLNRLVEVKGDKARLLPVSERTNYLFGKEEAQAPTKRKKKDVKQLSLFDIAGSNEDEDNDWGEKNVPQLGNTTLDRIHQSMILFAAGRSEALKRFLVEEGAGTDQRFWRLAQALSALYPNGTDEKRWVDGVLARKKGLGF